MPQLPKAQTKRLILPSTEMLPEDQQVWIDHKTLLTVSDLMKYDSSLSDMQNMAIMLCQIIVGWNVTDESNQAVPVSIDTIGLLPTTDLKPLTDIIDKLTPDIKEVVSANEKKA